MSDQTITIRNAAPAAQQTTTSTPEVPRLAFTMEEAGLSLGYSYPSIWRLVKRGKLKTCGGLRKKLIAKTELERFLRETTVLAE